ncbi:MAG: GIY-YIG nuclease family protein [Bacteroidetes bacterium]|nr:GIY-YIG nuclease family protein [Bacteroidota bacterium]
MYAIVDIETTGGHAAAHAITEIAIHIHDGNRVVKHFQSLINPERKLPLYITALTGISNEMTDSAPTFEELAETIHSLLKECVFVAHNVNFDYSFLKHHCKLSGYELNTKKLCTVRLSRKLFKGLPSYSLGNLCRSLGISIENRHRADGDATATVAVFDKILQNNGQPVIDAMLKKSSSEQWLPIQIDKQQIEQLPSGPGVYYFHDSKGKIIYVGKAINLKKRVSSHFTHNDAERKRQHFLRHVNSITYKNCVSELHALVLESTEIKRLWPKYNYSQKQPMQQFGLYCYEDNKGYLRLAIDKRKKNFPSLYNFNLLHEGLVLLRKMADEFGLHQKLCNLDKSALSKKDIEFLDAPPVYNSKVKQAMTALEEQLQTFAIVDEGNNSEEKLYLLMERGNFWGMGYVPVSQEINNINELKEKLQPYADNDFIRNSLYAYAEANPEKKIILP